MSNMSDVIHGNYNHCSECKWLEIDGKCYKLQKSVLNEIGNNIRVEDCPKRSGRYTWKNN